MLDVTTEITELLLYSTGVLIEGGRAARIPEQSNVSGQLTKLRSRWADVECPGR